MMDQATLESVLLARMPGCQRLVACERLSAGASRETYRLTAEIKGAERLLCLRRAQDEGKSAMKQGPGLDVEERLFAAARKAGVPGPEVFFSLEPQDGLGVGFVMEWISGETLGAKIARSADFARARKSLARQCGEILAKLHRIDLTAAELA